MKIERLKLADFRNIPFAELELSETANLIWGENGQGKTNLLEAIWLLTGAKSFRGAKDSQLVRFDCPQASIEATFFSQQRQQSARLTIERNRVAALNEIPLKSPSELAGNFCAVVFSPVHLNLVKNGPQEKRKFLDTAICQLKPKYIHMLAQYTRALDQRNRLLKDAAYAPALFDTLDVWDMRLCSFAAVLIKTRASFLDRLCPFATEVYDGISREKERLSLRYESSLAVDCSGTIAEIEQQALDCLRANRAEDLRARMSLSGPHRDDVELLLGGVSARAFGSQGQQRSCVLALKLAECELIRENLGEYPVVLLDDVMSELDSARRDYLLNHLGGRQLIMTCCDESQLASLGSGIGIELREGRVASVEQRQ